MNRFYQLNPECPGSLGNDSIVIDRNAAIWQLEKFQIVLEQWPQDDLIESMLAGTAVTEKLSHALRQSTLTGFELAPMDVLEGDQLFLWKQDHPEGLPKLVWLKIVGVSGRDDFGISAANATIVSARALQLLKQFKLENCDIQEYQPEIQSEGVPQKGW